MFRFFDDLVTGEVIIVTDDFPNKRVVYSVDPNGTATGALYIKEDYKNGDAAFWTPIIHTKTIKTNRESHKKYFERLFLAS